MPNTCGQLNNQQNFIFISTHPVEVKDVYYNHENGTVGRLQKILFFHYGRLRKIPSVSILEGYEKSGETPMQNNN